MNRNGFVAFTMGLCLFVPLSALLILAPPASADDPPRLLDYITDEVGVLLYSAYYIDTYGACDIVHSETSCDIVILVINSTGERPIADYAIEVFNANGIGNEEKNNGVLILVATGDNAYFIAVGSGLEYVLNDAKVGRFARDYFVPYAEEGEFGYAIFSLTVVIAWEIVEKYEQATPHRYPIEWIPLEWPELILTVSVFLAVMIITKGRCFFWIGALLRKFGGGRTSGGGAGGRYR